MTNYLVLTAMGTDRPGLVSKLARLASDCDCDIVDSRMALFGNEFTLIMMVSGSWSAITKIETSLPSLCMELELLTVMKRTSQHIHQNYISRIEVNFEGSNQRGTIKQISHFLAERGIDLGAVRSHAKEDDMGNQQQSIYLSINIPEKVELEQLKKSINELANELSLECSIKHMQGIE